MKHLNPNSFWQRTCIVALLAFALIGCDDGISKYQKPVNVNDPTGMGLTPEKRKEMIASDPSMSADQKAAALQRISGGRHIMARQQGSTP